MSFLIPESSNPRLAWIADASQAPYGNYLFVRPSAKIWNRCKKSQL